MSLSKEAKKAQALYMREWRKKNKDKVQEYNKKNREKYWEKKARELNLDSRTEKEGEL